MDGQPKIEPKNGFWVDLRQCVHRGDKRNPNRRRILRQRCDSIRVSPGFETTRGMGSVDPRSIHAAATGTLSAVNGSRLHPSHRRPECAGRAGPRR
jgi:hypothetical protein